MNAKPPYNEATELAVIGAIAVWPGRVLDDVLAVGLRPEDFYVPAHARAWSTILELASGDTPIDPHVLGARIGNPRLVASAIWHATGSDTGPYADCNPGNAPAWAHCIAAFATARAIITPLEAALHAAYDGQVDEAVELIHDALTALGVPA